MLGGDLLRLPRPHHKQLKGTNMLERLNEEIKRRTRAGEDLHRRRVVPEPRARPVRRDAQGVTGNRIRRRQSVHCHDAVGVLALQEEIEFANDVIGSPSNRLFQWDVPCNLVKNNVGDELAVTGNTGGN